MAASEPDFLVCRECENPCYVFDWDDKSSKITDVLCTTCGNDKPEEFYGDEDIEEET